MARRKRVRSVWGTPRGAELYGRYKAGKLSREQLLKEAGKVWGRPVTAFSLGQFEKWQDPQRKPYGALAMDRNWAMPRDEVDTFLRTADIAGAAVHEVWEREKAELVLENTQLKATNAQLRELLEQARRRFEQAAKGGAVS